MECLCLTRRELHNACRLLSYRISWYLNNLNTRCSMCSMCYIMLIPANAESSPMGKPCEVKMQSQCPSLTVPYALVPKTEIDRRTATALTPQASLQEWESQRHFAPFIASSQSSHSILVLPRSDPWPILPRLGNYRPISSAPCSRRSCLIRIWGWVSHIRDTVSLVHPFSGRKKSGRRTRLRKRTWAGVVHTWDRLSVWRLPERQRLSMMLAWIYAGWEHRLVLRTASNA